MKKCVELNFEKMNELFKLNELLEPFRNSQFGQFAGEFVTCCKEGDMNKVFQSYGSGMKSKWLQFRDNYKDLQSQPFLVKESEILFNSDCENLVPFMRALTMFALKINIINDLVVNACNITEAGISIKSKTESFEIWLEKNRDILANIHKEILKWDFQFGGDYYKQLKLENLDSCLSDNCICFPPLPLYSSSNPDCFYASWLMDFFIIAFHGDDLLYINISHKLEGILGSNENFSIQERCREMVKLILQLNDSSPYFGFRFPFYAAGVEELSSVINDLVECKLIESVTEEEW